MTPHFTEPTLVLATAEILYRLPDFQTFLQTYVWQEKDMTPHYPKLREFLLFWERELDGPIVGVRVMHENLLSSREFRAYNEGMIIVH